MTGAAGLTWQPLLPALAVLVGAVAGLALLALAWRRDPRPGGGRVWGARAAVVVVVAVALLGPGYAGAAPAYEERREQQLLLVVDRTVSMSAPDAGGGESRLDQLREDLARLGERFGDERLAVLTWGSQARLALPFTTDDRAFAQTLRSLRREDPAEGVGSRVDRPLELMSRVLQRARRQHPDRHTVVVFASDGENTRSGEQQSFTTLDDLVDGGAVVGYGTDAGATMPLTEDGSVLVPDVTTGAPAVSRRDQENLRTVADQLGVTYVPRERLDIDALVEAATPPARLVRVTGAGSRQLVWVLGLPLLALLLVELRRSWLDLHEARRLRRRR